MPIFGTLAVIASMTIALVGFPTQIYRNYKRQNCDGIAPVLIYSAFISYLLWTLYAWTKPDLFLIVTDTTGVILTSILILQNIYYKNKALR
ncbi:MAG: hypothetical protein A3I24_02485 [Candidatus Harrisonbacteria bacterium RIFCSPLOWO2_02_FULL_41_13b]|uniref:MtN3 and saliva related transmembrane protein n=1 Tax=Candidatus Harrisonbacteria bacterium RIFCSPLOWO2_02_FULL_41_13b TaxID=1798409 RepID=A0A1G1ZU85_9BACT|nr:MAG: hypothetical protein A3J53_02460 [Candidatus Harrisonbacteria bacterium RIFCSPHIGHO2_02_FULL_40_20]OGY68114.1 MAG: hypothetical protein A3I24_02485 [Candidatus Harrisonbacteria bacterium RIFCSPLOWO2_02_FULL_41_13b]